MEIILLLIPVAMLSFFLGTLVNAITGDKKAYEEGVQFGRHLEKRKLRSYRKLGLFKPRYKHLIDADDSLR
jgi:hypothetical protein